MKQAAIVTAGTLGKLGPVVYANSIHAVLRAAKHVNAKEKVVEIKEFESLSDALKHLVDLGGGILILVDRTQSDIAEEIAAHLPEITVFIITAVATVPIGESMFIQGVYYINKSAKSEVFESIFR